MPRCTAVVPQGKTCSEESVPVKERGTALYITRNEALEWQTE